MPFIVCKLLCKSVLKRFTVTFVAGDIVGGPALYFGHSNSIVRLPFV